MGWERGAPPCRPVSGCVSALRVNQGVSWAAVGGMHMSEFELEIPAHPVENPGLWHRSELGDPGSWFEPFPAGALAEIDEALQAVKSRGLKAQEFGAAEFPLPEFGQMIRTLGPLETRRGFCLWRGFPVERYTQSELEAVFWGIGRHIGTPVPVNAEGHLLGHVHNLGYDVRDTKVRNYQTAAELCFHNDTSDIIGLMCLSAPRSGGTSGLASVAAIHNSIMNERPDLLRELYQPMAIDRRGEAGWPEEGPDPYFALPIFTYHKGYLTARVSLRSYYESAQRFAGVPPLTERQNEALDLFEETSRRPEMHIEFDLQPGDIQLINNYCVLHRRGAFEDWPEPERRRHLLRLWLSVPDSRPLHPIYETRFRSVESGALRGGIAPRSESAAA